jgi:hypothetical protein
MVRITTDDRHLTLEPVGWSKVWTLRTRVRVPLASIVNVQRAPSDIGRGVWKGLRLPGTHVPGLIVAGSYYRTGGWEFWDVRVLRDRAIEVTLQDAPYRRLVVDVSDPSAEVERLRAALARTT